MTSNYEGLITSILNDPKNLSTEAELNIQLHQALVAFKRSDIDESGYLSNEEVKYLCSIMGLPLSEDEEEV
jgi:Ca2+-binding EF-hand superfamily protein